MKKSQVLAALALAFALGLGVVAPVANTYAYVVAPAQAEEAKKLNEDLQTAINEAKEIAGYQAYANMIDAIEEAQKDIKTSKETIASALYGYLTGTDVDITVVDYKGVAATNEDGDAITTYSYKLSTVKEADKEDYDKLMAAAKAAQAALTTKVQSYNNYDTDTYKDLKQTQLDEIAKNRNDLLAVTNIIDSVAGTLNTRVTETGDLTTLASGVEGVLSANDYEELTDSDDYENATVIGKIDILIAAGKADKSYNYFNKLVAAVNDAQAVLTDTEKYPAGATIADGQKALNALNAALNNTATTPVDPEGPNKTVTLSNSNVTVTGDFEDGVILTVKKAEVKVDAFGTRKVAAYDITLTKDGKDYNVDGKNVKVTIKFEGVDGSKAGVYHVNGDKADYLKDATISGDVATFTTNHFSVYAIVEDAAGGLPNTGVIAAAVEGNASTTVAMVAGIATALTAAGAGVVAYRNARRSVRK